MTAFLLILLSLAGTPTSQPSSVLSTQDSGQASFSTPTRRAATQPAGINIFSDGEHDAILLWPQHSGRPGSPTVLRAEHAGQAVIRAKAPYLCGIYAPDDQVMHDLVIEGFVIEGSQVSGVHFWHSDSIILRNCQIRTSINNGAAFHACSRVTVEHCLIEANGRDQQAHGIYTDGSEITIRDCVIRNNAGWGVHLWPVCSGCVVDSNLIYGNRGYGVVIAHSDNPPATELPNRVVRNLIVANNGGIQVHRGFDDLVERNAVYGNVAGYWLTLNAPAVRSVTVRDNAHGDSEKVYDPAKKARITAGATLDIGPTLRLMPEVRSEK